MKKILILVFVGGVAFNVQAKTWNKFWYGAGSSIGALTTVAAAASMGEQIEKIKLSNRLNELSNLLNQLYKRDTGRNNIPFGLLEINPNYFVERAIITIICAYLTKLLYDKCCEEDAKEKELIVVK
ncbi:MAG: hypothetical protein P4L22_04415 [Candidatus Babeliales bacterium]|nr:hypothetical protein [Candidatus Babeliales bacterium]